MFFSISSAAFELCMCCSVHYRNKLLTELCATWPPELSLLWKSFEFYSENAIRSFSWTGQTHSYFLMQSLCGSCSSFTAEPILSLSEWSFPELCVSGSDWTFSDKKDVFWLPGQHQLSSCLQNYVTWNSFFFQGSLLRTWNLMLVPH